jgi:hypothetical protein
VGDLTRFQESIWDQVFDFVFDCDEDLSRAQVQEELRRRGIDLTQAHKRVHKALATARARVELEVARQSRPRILARLSRIVPPEVNATLDDMKRAIAAQFQGQMQLAFFRKLEAAESEDDLKSLLKDAYVLDILSEDADDVGTATQ